MTTVFYALLMYFSMVINESLVLVRQLYLVG